MQRADWFVAFLLKRIEDFVGFLFFSRQKMSRMDKCHPLLFSHGLQLHSPTCQLSSGTFVVHPAEYL